MDITLGTIVFWAICLAYGIIGISGDYDLFNWRLWVILIFILAAYASGRN